MRGMLERMAGAMRLCAKHEKVQGFRYDLVVMTRFDLVFLERFTFSRSQVDPCSFNIAAHVDGPTLIDGM